MSATISFSIDLSKIDKSKVIQGKKGTYYNVVAFINDATDPYGKNVKVASDKSKEERESGAETHWLGSGRVIKNDGSIVVAESTQQAQQAPAPAPADDMDFPF